MGRDALVDVLPETGLIRDYYDYTQGNEICARFRVFPFLAAMGGIIKRKVYFQRSSYDLFPRTYPNPWIILVAPQGRGHKSAALSIAKKLLTSLPDRSQPKFMASKLTPEALVKSLAGVAVNPEIAGALDPNMVNLIKKPAQAILYSSELGTLLGREKYNQGMIALLTDLYDCHDEWWSDTVMRGDQRMHNICLSIMGASTPDWMQTMLPSDAFKGGFMSRMILVGYPEELEEVRIADPSPGDPKLREKVTARLAEIANIEGIMDWTKEAKSFFAAWYEGLTPPDPGPKAAFLERKQDHLLKIAMLVQLAWGNQLTMTLEALQQSMALLNSIEPDSLRMVDYISVEPRMRIAQRVLEVVEAYPKGATESTIVSSTWRWLASPREFEEIIRMMLKAKMIVMTTVDGEMAYKKGLSL